jgi:hypothetical protein
MDTVRQKSLNDEQRIIGQHHRDPELFLLSAPDLIPADPERAPIERARILDMHRKMLFAPRPLISILARAPYDIYAGDQGILPGLLEQVEEVDD